MGGVLEWLKWVIILGSGNLSGLKPLKGYGLMSTMYHQLSLTVSLIFYKGG